MCIGTFTLFCTRIQAHTSSDEHDEWRRGRFALPSETSSQGFPSGKGRQHG